MTAASCRTRRYYGRAAADGSAAGVLYQADAVARRSAVTAGEVEAAFAAVATERRELADRLREAGRPGEADIVAVAAMIAADPILAGAAVAAVRDGADAAVAVRQAAAEQAAALAAIPDPELADRATDVRQVGAAVLEHLAGGPLARPDGEFIIVRHDVAAADLIELAEVGLVGAASVSGGASSHAAIIARGLGIPMITGIDEAVLAEPACTRAILDADAGWLAVQPEPRQWLAARTSSLAGLHAPSVVHPRPAGQPATADGQEILVLCNAASAAETRRGLTAGAGGMGLLRTEIPFTGWHRWPTRDEHLARLRPVLELLGGRPATVRLLDFSGDKIPPFLRASSAPAGSGRAQAGLAALLAHPSALRHQLSAVLQLAAPRSSPS